MQKLTQHYATESKPKFDIQKFWDSIFNCLGGYEENTDFKFKKDWLGYENNQYIFKILITYAMMESVGIFINRKLADFCTLCGVTLTPNGKAFKKFKEALSYLLERNCFEFQVQVKDHYEKVTPQTALTLKPSMIISIRTLREPPHRGNAATFYSDWIADFQRESKTAWINQSKILAYILLYSTNLFTYKEVAKVVGCSERTVASYFAKFFDEIKTLNTPYGPIELSKKVKRTKDEWVDRDGGVNTAWFTEGTTCADTWLKFDALSKSMPALTNYLKRPDSILKTQDLEDEDDAGWTDPAYYASLPSFYDDDGERDQI